MDRQKQSNDIKIYLSNAEFAICDASHITTMLESANLKIMQFLFTDIHIKFYHWDLQK